MRNLLRLTLCFFAVFVLTGAGAAGFVFFSLWAECALEIPSRSILPFSALLDAVSWVGPFAFYASLLAAGTYAARRSMFWPASLLALTLFGAAASFGAEALSQKLLSLKIGPLNFHLTTLGGPGMKISEGASTITLVTGHSGGQNGRVVSSPGQPLVFTRSNESPLPPISLLQGQGDSPSYAVGRAFFFNAIIRDFSLSATLAQERFSRGKIAFLAYEASLSLLLASFCAALGRLSWPLASLAGCLIGFRLILALEPMLPSSPVQRFLDAFLSPFLSQEFLSAALFALLALILILLSLLSRIVSPSLHAAPKQRRPFAPIRVIR